MTSQPRLGGAHETTPLAAVDHRLRRAERWSRLGLDLDEDEPPAAAHDQVELAAGQPEVAAEDAVGAEAVVPERAPLSSPP